MEVELIKGNCYKVKFLCGRVYDPEPDEEKQVYVGCVNGDTHVFAISYSRPEVVHLLYVTDKKNITPSDGVRLTDKQYAKVREHLEREGFEVPFVHPSYSGYEPRECLRC